MLNFRGVGTTGINANGSNGPDVEIWNVDYAEVRLEIEQLGMGGSHHHTTTPPELK